MARKGWGSLSPAYRARLEKAGLTRTEYEQGVSLQKARGHERTPERPTRANPQKHAQYISERKRLTAELEAKKDRLFGDRPRWDEDRSSRAIREYPPTMNHLRWAVSSKATEQDLVDAIREDAETFRFLGYH